MSAEREDIWARLEGRAHRLLEHAKDLEPREPIRRYGSLWRLWHYPAFGPQRTWTVLTPGKRAVPGAEPMVREITWNRDMDHRAIFDPCAVPDVAWPTLGIRDAWLPGAEVEQLCEQATGLAIPVAVAQSTMGLDGEFFGLETYEVSPNLRLQWWGDGPVEWRHFTDWVAGLRSFLQMHLDRTG